MKRTLLTAALICGGMSAVAQDMNTVPCGRTQTCVLTVIMTYAVATGTYADPRPSVGVGMFMHDFYGGTACDRAMKRLKLEAHAMNVDARAWCTPKEETEK